MTEKCFADICFVPLNVADPKFFGFSDFWAGLALMVLVWTIADTRYRFRIRTAPIPLQVMTFTVVTVVGFLTLLTDLWRSSEWLVPRGSFISPEEWQGVLGGSLFLTFLVWAWFAFIRPPIYSKYNAGRFAYTLYHFILKGTPIELSIIADELARSIRSLVKHATNHDKYRDIKSSEPKISPPTHEAYANDILLLLTDKRFCRAVVQASPVTAQILFQEISKTQKYGIQVQTFAKNIVNEALLDVNSFLYHESEGYESGFMGYLKPLSQAMFADYRLVETVGTLLEPDFSNRQEWNASQWKAYCRIVLIVFKSYVDKEFWNHSFVLFKAKGYIEHAARDTYKLNGIADINWGNDILDRLRVIVEFIVDAIKILDSQKVPQRVALRVRGDSGRMPPENFYDHLAKMIFEVIFSSSAVKSPRNQCWWVQYNTVWGELFNFGHLDSSAGKIIKFKVRRLLYDEILRMKDFPNIKGAKIIGFCLNVLGLSIKETDYDKDGKALQKAVLSWVRQNFVWLHNYNPRVAEDCLVDGITYDPANRRLVRTYPEEGLRREPHYVYLNLDPPKPELKKAGDPANPVEPAEQQGDKT